MKNNKAFTHKLSSRRVSVRDISCFVIPRTTTLRGDGSSGGDPEQQLLKMTPLFLSFVILNRLFYRLEPPRSVFVRGLVKIGFSI